MIPSRKTPTLRISVRHLNNVGNFTPEMYDEAAFYLSKVPPSEILYREGIRYKVICTMTYDRIGSAPGMSGGIYLPPNYKKYTFKHILRKVERQLRLKHA